ncbi:MAG: LptF/LptG family permease [Pirellulales bacterium]
MRIIDRYLSRQFAQVFVVCFISLTGLYIVIDAFGHLDEFINQAGPQGGLFTVLTRYYGYRSLVFFDRTSSILALISAMFTVTWIQRYNELTALMAAGLPRLRIVMPVLIGAMSISLLGCGIREWIIPPVRGQLAVDSHDLSGQSGRAVHPRHDNRTGIFLDGDKVFPRQQRITHPCIGLPASLSRFGSRLEATSARYHPANEVHPAGYLLKDVSRPQAVDERPSLVVQGHPIIITSTDAEWLQAKECFVVTDVNAEMLEDSTSWRQYASTAELVRGLANTSVDFGADVRVAIHARLIKPLMDATLLMLGLPLVLTRNNRNVFMAIGLCLVVIVLFMLVVLACQFLGASSMVRPALAAWLPLIIFVPVAANSFAAFVE